MLQTLRFQASPQPTLTQELAKTWTKAKENSIKRQLIGVNVDERQAAEQDMRSFQAGVNFNNGDWGAKYTQTKPVDIELAPIKNNGGWKISYGPALFTVTPNSAVSVKLAANAAEQLIILAKDAQNAKQASLDINRLRISG